VLKSAISELEKEKEPSKDLWPEIASSLESREEKSVRNTWISWSAVATLTLSVGILAFSWNKLEQAELMMKQAESISVQYEERLISQLDSMEREYRLARSTFLAQIQYNSQDQVVDGEENNLQSDLYEQLVVFEKATNELKAAIKAQPSDPNLPKLLKATYQQELAVLSKLAKLNQNVFSEERI